MVRKSLAIASVLALAVTLGGCGISIGGGGQGGGTPPNGFVFRTADGGATWRHAAVQLRPGANALSLANTAVTFVALDPSDSKGMYAGTPDRGLFYSYNGGQDWAATLENLGPIGPIAVDPLDRCTVYAAIGTALHKTVDCTRSWTRTVVAGGKATNGVTAVLVDAATAGRAYIGTALGELHRSEDGGQTWTLLNRFNSAVQQVVQNPNDPAVLYVVAANRGVFRSADGGATWADVNPRDPYAANPERARVIRGATAVRDLALDYTVRDGMVVASDAGLWRTDDGGVTWSSSSLPVSLDRGVRLGQLAVDRTDGSHMFVTVGNRLAVTQTGGEAWGWFDLPSARPVVDLVWPAGTDYLFAAFGPAPK